MTDLEGVHARLGLTAAVAGTTADGVEAGSCQSLKTFESYEAPPSTCVPSLAVPCGSLKTKSLDVLLLASANNSLCQRVEVELTQRGHKVRIHVQPDGSPESEALMIQAVESAKPQLVLCPMLRTFVPRRVWEQFLTIIVHPGIKGDRGPSSLDWAILDGETEWGCTLLQAIEEMDAGDIWASETFPLKSDSCSKSHIYRHEFTQAAIRGILKVVEVLSGEGSQRFKPVPLDYTQPDVRGRARPLMKLADRMIDWKSEPTRLVDRKIRSADSQPGILDRIQGLDYFLFGSHVEEDSLLLERLCPPSSRAQPGDIVATKHGAILRKTVDGAVWITHLKRRKDATPSKSCNVKLPARMVLEMESPETLRDIPEVPSPSIREQLEQASMPNVTKRSWNEIEYEERNGVGYLSFDFYNGAMSTEQGHRLLEAYRSVIELGSARVLVLLGGRDMFSNGIHLNVIEVSKSPAEESWRNINAIDDVVLEILKTTNKIVISGIQGNAAAGGVMLALASDFVFAREGVVLNPHYKKMGLYGSEYWTYSLPRRVGPEMALMLTEETPILSTSRAKEIGLIDDYFGTASEEFLSRLRQTAESIASSSSAFLPIPLQRRITESETRSPRTLEELMELKTQDRSLEESKKPLAQYRAEELAKMRVNFFEADSFYHTARHRFVHKLRCTGSTPNCNSGSR